MPRISIIVATDERGAIGRDGRLPWHLPNDLQRFKALTLGKPILMGRRTWDSIGRPLPGRLNVVITRQPQFAAPGCAVVASLDDALEVAKDSEVACVIGGAEIYRLALPRAEVIHRTQVHATVAADTFFPPLKATDWEEIAREDHPADDRHAYPYSFVELRRRT